VNVFTISVPALRERHADVPALAEYFLSKYAEQHGSRVRRISSSAIEALSAYSWPGNVRELENVMERAVVVARGGVIEERDLPELIRSGDKATTGAANLSLAKAVAELERRMIGEALERSRGNYARAARALGATERIVRYKAGKHGIDPDQYK
jgi:Nif-specific regulatory protein